MLCYYQYLVIIFFFFFSSRRRHTRYWRDWSSDVCSSDLLGNKHTLGALLGNTIQGNVASQTFAQGTNFPNDSYKQIASAATTTSSTSREAFNLLSYFSRVDYNYDSRYYAEFSVRADASSKFGTNHKWGYFPSAGIAWRAKEESFLRGVDFLSDLKVRGSVGL